MKKKTAQQKLKLGKIKITTLTKQSAMEGNRITYPGEVCDPVFSIDFCTKKNC
jgi:hypothetical protein